MSQKLTQSPDQEWDLLRVALRANHSQERKDNRAAEGQAQYRLDERHQQEMAQISLFLHPRGWAETITRYRSQQAESFFINKTRRQLIITRQRKEWAELEQWIAQQQGQFTDVAQLNQLGQFFSWSLPQYQWQTYHQALTNGRTLIVTDLQKLIVWTSHNFVTLTGYWPSEVVGQSAQLLQGSATNEAMLGYLREQLRLAQPVEVELWNYHKSQRPYLCHMRIEPLFSDQGDLTHFVAIEHVVKPAAL